MEMSREQVIQELKVFIEYFEKETGATPICMTEAIRYLQEDSKHETIYMGK